MGYVLKFHRIFTIAVGIVSSSSSNCLITKFDSTLTMSPSNPIWVYYPPSSGYKTISINNPQPTNATIKLNLKTSRYCFFKTNYQILVILQNQFLLFDMSIMLSIGELLMELICGYFLPTI